jgi:CRP/FNR family transcriptional regulator, anaerobic regulatory protein
VSGIVDLSQSLGASGAHTFRVIVRIAIVEDQRIVREAVVAVLEREADFAVVGEAAHAADGVALALRERPDVLLVDLNLPGDSGVEVALSVRDAAPQIRVVALSAHVDAVHVQAMLEAGAAAYIDKFSALDDLARGIRLVMQGKLYLSPQAAGAAPEPQPNPPRMSHQRKDVLGQLASGWRRLRGGERLFNDGDAFGAVYHVTSGFFKTVALEAGGRGQVTGFFIPGDLVGLEGVDEARHRGTAIALEYSEAAVLPYALIETRSRQDQALQHLIHVAFSRDIARKQNVMLLLGSMRAEERLAFFLLDLSARYARRGYSPDDLRLPMTREDIGSYLGLTVETVSRLFTRFHRQRILQIRQRQLKLLDVACLRRMAGAAVD